MFGIRNEYLIIYIVRKNHEEKRLCNGWLKSSYSKSNRFKETVRVFQKLGLEKSKIVLKNVTDKGFEIPFADVYFIYDFSNSDDISTVLNQIANKKSNKKSLLVLNILGKGLILYRKLSIQQTARKDSIRGHVIASK